MTSQIISDVINAAYPVAGVDNNTQGFRDNFQAIKDGLATAASEITILQENTAKLDEDNNFNGSQIASALFVDSRHQTSILGQPLTTNVEIDVSTAYYFKRVIGGNLQLNVTGWPDDSYAKIVLELAGAGLTNNTNVWNVTLNTGATDFKTTTSWPATIAVDDGTTDSHIIEIWSWNGGITVFANYVGKFIA